MYGFKVTDYSVFKQCKSLKKIIIFDSSIENVEDLMGLKHLEWLGLSNTPISDDLEEIKKIKEVYPDIKFEY